MTITSSRTRLQLIFRFLLVISVAASWPLCWTTQSSIAFVAQLPLTLREFTVPDLDSELDRDRQGAFLEFARTCDRNAATPFLGSQAQCRCYLDVAAGPHCDKAAFVTKQLGSRRVVGAIERDGAGPLHLVREAIQGSRPRLRRASLRSESVPLGPPALSALLVPQPAEGGDGRLVAREGSLRHELAPRNRALEARAAT